MFFYIAIFLKYFLVLKPKELREDLYKLMLKMQVK